MALHRSRSDVPETIEPCVIRDFDSIAIPTAPIVPFVECVHDRIAIEIMRGCPWQCRFCQSTVIKRSFRSVDTIINAAMESYKNTGFNEISILSLSSSDYPHFEELVTRMKATFNPMGVNISVPSLRVNEQLRTLADLVGNGRQGGLTLAPEVARDDMREQIRKKIKNEDLYEGCRTAFKNNYETVKLYFMCGLPGERDVDLDGIVEMAEHIARIGKEVKGRFPKVTASVSNFVPKAHTPYRVERYATSRILSTGPPIPLAKAHHSLGEHQVSQRGNESIGRSAQPRRSTHVRCGRAGVATRSAHGWLDRDARPSTLVEGPA